MPAVIFAVILGMIIGLTIHLGDKIDKAAGGMQRIIGRLIKAGGNGMPEDEFIATLITIFFVLCQWNRNLWITGFWHGRRP